MEKWSSFWVTSCHMTTPFILNRKLQIFGVSKAALNASIPSGRDKPLLRVLTAPDGGLLGLMNQAIQPFQELFGRQVLRRSSVVGLLPVGGDPTRVDLLGGLVVSAVDQQRLQAAVGVQQQRDGQGLLQVDGVIGVHPVGSFDLLHLGGGRAGSVNTMKLSQFTLNGHSTCN